MLKQTFTQEKVALKLSGRDNPSLAVNRLSRPVRGALKCYLVSLSLWIILFLLTFCSTFKARLMFALMSLGVGLWKQTSTCLL